MTPVACFGAGHRKIFFPSRTFRAIHARSQCTCEQYGIATWLQRLSGPAGSWAQAGTRRAGRPADAVPARQAWVDWRRPEQSGNKRVLHSHTEQAPPPPVPALGGSSSERSRSNRSTQGSRTKELGVGSALAAFGDGQGSTVPGG